MEITISIRSIKVLAMVTFSIIALMAADSFIHTVAHNIATAAL